MGGFVSKIGSEYREDEPQRAVLSERGPNGGEKSWSSSYYVYKTGDVGGEEVDFTFQLFSLNKIELLGNILSYVDNSETLCTFLALCKSVRAAIRKEKPLFSRNVEFVFSRPKCFQPDIRLLYVHRLTLKNNDVKESQLKYFPNLEALTLMNVTSIKSKAIYLNFKFLSELRVFETETVGDLLLEKLQSKIEILEIHNSSGITDVGLSKLKKLYNLKLSRVGNQITQKSFQNLPEIISLHLSACTFSNLHPEGTSLVNLRKLHLEYFHEFKDENLMSFPKLEILILHYCDNFKGKTLHELPKLKVLKIYWCYKIDKECKFPKSLERASLKGCIGVTGSQFDGCEKLSRLTLVEQHLFTDDILSKMKNLKRLKLISCNGCTRKIFGELKKLEKVHIINCESVVQKDFRSFIVL